MNNTVFGRCTVSQIIQFRKCIFSKTRTILLSFEAGNCVCNKLQKYNKSNSAEQGLTLKALNCEVKSFFSDIFTSSNVKM